MSADRTDQADRGLSVVGVVASGFTMLCCLGVSVAISLATSVSATFLTRDATLRPLLIVSLSVTIVASALTYRRHRETILPLLVTVGASVWIYALIFVVDTGHGAGHGGAADHMHDAHAASSHAGIDPVIQVLVFAGFAVLVAAQVWDWRRVGTRRRTAPIPEGAS